MTSVDEGTSYEYKVETEELYEDLATPFEKFNEIIYNSLTDDISSYISNSLSKHNLQALIINGNESGFRVNDEIVKTIMEAIEIANIPIETVSLRNNRITG